jgi:hypothetical protein
MKRNGMQFLKGSWFAGLFSALLFTCAPANGSSITVTDDSGGGSLISVTGTSTGGTVVGHSTDINTFEVNGVTGLTIPTSVMITITDGALVAGVRSISASGQAVFGTTSGHEAILNFTATGIAFGANIDLSGTVGSLSENAYPGYDFSLLAANPITLSINRTNTNYTNVLGNTGVVVSHSGLGYQMQAPAVPEPTSMALLGIGLSSLFAFRRLFARPSVA